MVEPVSLTVVLVTAGVTVITLVLQFLQSAKIHHINLFSKTSKNNIMIIHSKDKNGHYYKNKANDEKFYYNKQCKKSKKDAKNMAENSSKQSLSSD